MSIFQFAEVLIHGCVTGWLVRWLAHDLTVSTSSLLIQYYFQTVLFTYLFMFRVKEASQGQQNSVKRNVPATRCSFYKQDKKMPKNM